MVRISPKRVGYLCIIGVFLLVSFINESAFVSAGNVGYELLDSNKVLHIWNMEDDYFFNATSGMQFTNHYDDYWSKNVFCGGWYDGDDWNVLACIDELPFTWSIDTDDSTYINITGYKDITYMGREVRFALRYHLKEWDTRLSVQPYMKNIGTLNIPLDMGFAWHIRDIEIDNEEEENTIMVYSENINYSLANDFEKTWVNSDGSLFIRNENTGEHIFMSWNPEITHAVQVMPVAGQYNSPVSLGLKVGTLAVGQEKTTTIKWVDADPTCGNVGTDGDEDLCFFEGISASSYTNYSDALYSDADFPSIPAATQRFPRFKITTASTMPFGCTYLCKILRQDSDDIWSEVYTGTGLAGCYNQYIDNAGFCNTGYCRMLHTKTIDDMTNWDACIYYTGESCAEDGNVYCGIGDALELAPSSNGDSRVNMSYNQNTPLDYNASLINWTNITGIFLNISFDTWMGTDLDGKEISFIKWYYDEVYNHTDNITYTTGRTYQSDANDTSSIGNWAAFLPFANVIDGNWAGTPGGTFPPNTAYGYMNYTKIANAYAVEWEVKDNCDRVNLSIPHECFSAKEDTVSFKIFSDGANGDAYWYCWNGTAWYDVRSSCKSSQVFWEEAVHWKTEVQDNTITLDVTDLCSENITFEVETWDDSYFSPTNNQTQVASENSWFEACTVIIQKVRDSYWLLAIVMSLVGFNFILFMGIGMLNEWKLKAILYFSQVLFIGITIHFVFIALHLYENANVISTFETIYQIVFLAVIIPVYVIYIITLIIDGVKSLNKV